MKYFAMFTVLVLAVLVAVSVPLAIAEEPVDTEAVKKSARVPLDVPAADKNRKNPEVSNADATAFGKKLFSSQCVMCHGKGGDGSGDLAMKLGMPVPDFTSAAEQKEWTDGEMFYVIVHGHGRMQGQHDRFKDEHVWGMVNHIRSLAR
jgi:mono/diheme cytochrome c family protein